MHALGARCPAAPRAALEYAAARSPPLRHGHRQRAGLALLQWRLELDGAGLLWTGALAAVGVSGLSLGLGAHPARQMRIAPARCCARRLMGLPIKKYVAAVDAKRRGRFAPRFMRLTPLKGLGDPGRPCRRRPRAGSQDGAIGRQVDLVGERSPAWRARGSSWPPGPKRPTAALRRGSCAPARSVQPRATAQAVASSAIAARIMPSAHHAGGRHSGRCGPPASTR